MRRVTLITYFLRDVGCSRDYSYIKCLLPGMLHGDCLYGIAFPYTSDGSDSGDSASNNAHSGCKRLLVFFGYAFKY